MRTVLYIASTFGHLRSFHIPYIQAMLDRGDDITLIASGDARGLPVGAKIISLPFEKRFTSINNFKSANSIAQILRANHYDLMLTHTSLAAFFARLGVKRAGRQACSGLRVVNTVHGYLFDAHTSTPKRTVLLDAERFTAGITSDIVTMNSEDTRIATDHHLCCGRVTQVAGMGVPLRRASTTTELERVEARQCLNIFEDAYVLLYAAEFSGRKNQAMLIDALPLLPSNVVLALPGQGDLRQECAAQAKKLGVSSRVIFPGFVEDLTTWRQAADVCVSASRIEGLPFHVIEAMACGLPSVLSDIKGHIDLMQGTNNEISCGLLYPFGDVDAFVQCVRRLYDNRDTARQMGLAAAQASRKYSLDRVMPKLMQLYS